MGYGILGREADGSTTPTMTVLKDTNTVDVWSSYVQRNGEVAAAASGKTHAMRQPIDPTCRSVRASFAILYFIASIMNQHQSEGREEIEVRRC